MRPVSGVESEVFKVSLPSGPFSGDRNGKTGVDEAARAGTLTQIRASRDRMSGTAETQGYLGKECGKPGPKAGLLRIQDQKHPTGRGAEL